VRRGISRAEVEALRKRAPTVDVPIAVIIRTIVDSSRSDKLPRTALQEALIAAAHAAYSTSRKVQRLILDSSDPAGGWLVASG
jgi:hypothetical protein